MAGLICIAVTLGHAGDPRPCIHNVLHILTWGMSRYRLPVDAALLIFAQWEWQVADGLWGQVGVRFEGGGSGHRVRQDAQRWSVRRHAQAMQYSAKLPSKLACHLSCASVSATTTEVSMATVVIV
jgi:hypothetical protein